MTALIRCTLHLSTEEIETMEDDDFWETWYQVKYYLKVVNQVKFD